MACNEIGNPRLTDDGKLDPCARETGCEQAGDRGRDTVSLGKS
ncbi:MAG: hypothetical protein ACLPT6_00940 [Desulfobaccales bacterium]